MEDNENLVWLYQQLGGEEEFGKIEEFRQALMDPTVTEGETNLDYVFEQVGGEAEFGNIEDFRTELGLVEPPQTQSFNTSTGLPPERQTQLGLDEFEDLDTYLRNKARKRAEDQRRQEILIAENPELAVTRSEADVFFSLDFWADNYKLGKIQGQIGNLNEVTSDLLSDQEGLDPEFYSKYADLMKQQAVLQKKMQAGRSREIGVGRYITDVFGGMVASPVAAFQEMSMDADGIATGIAATALAFGSGGTGLSIAMGIAGADVEAGSIMSEKIQEYGQKNGIDVFTEEGLRQVYQDTEFIERIKRKAMTGAAIVGTAEALSGGVAGKFGKTGQQIMKRSDVAYNYGGRMAIGAAFDGTGDAVKQQAVNGNIDWYSAAVEAGSGPAQTMIMTAVQNNADVGTMRTNQATQQYLDHVQEGNVRPREGDAGPSSTTSIAGDVNTTPQQEAQNIAEIDAAYEAANKARAASTRGGSEAVQSPVDTGGVGSPSMGRVVETVADETPAGVEDAGVVQSPAIQDTPEDELRLDAEQGVDLIEAGQRKKERTGPVRDQAIENHFDDDPEKTLALVTEMAKQNKLSQDAVGTYAQLSEDLSNFMTMLPENLRDAQTDQDRAKAREIVQSFLDRQTTEHAIHLAEKAAKRVDSNISKRELAKLAKEKQKLSDTNAHITRMMEVGDFTLADYDATTYLLRESQYKQGDNRRPSRFAIDVRANEVTVNDPDIMPDITQAVEKFNSTKMGIEGFTPLEIVNKQELQQSVDTNTPIDTNISFDFEANQPQLNVETTVGPVDLDNSNKQVKFKASEQFGGAKSGEQKSQIVAMHDNLQEQGRRLTAPDVYSMTDSTRQAFDALVDEGRATYSDKNGYRMKTLKERQSLDRQRVKKLSEKLTAKREVDAVRKQKVSAANLANQVGRAVASAGDNYTIEVLSQEDFSDRAGRGRGGDRAVVKNVNGARPTILINSSKATSLTIPHEVAHVLIAKKLGKNRGKLVREITAQLTIVLENGGVRDKQLNAQLNQMLDKYKERGIDDLDVLAEEFLAELSAFMSVAEQRLDKNPSLPRRLVRALKKALQAIFGDDLDVNSIEINSVNESIDFINGLADELSSKTPIQNPKILKSKNGVLTEVYVKKVLKDDHPIDNGVLDDIVEKIDEGTPLSLNESFIAAKYEKQINAKLGSAVNVMNEKGGILGYGERINPDGSSFGDVELNFVKVDVVKRGKGLAKKMVRRFTKQMDKEGKNSVLYVSPMDKNTDAKQLVKLYESFGFKLQPDGFTMTRGLEGADYALPEVANTTLPVIEDNMPTPAIDFTPTEGDAQVSGLAENVSLTKRNPVLGETVVYDGGEYTVTRVEGNKFDLRNDSGGGVNAATLHDKEFGGIISDERSSVDEDQELGDIEKEFIDSILSSTLNEQEKRDQLAAMGYDLDDYIQDGPTPPKFRPSDTELNDTRSAKEVADGVRYRHGTATTHEAMQARREAAGAPPLSSKRDVQSAAVQVEMAHKLDYLDPEQQIGLNTGKIITTLRNGMGINAYQYAALTQAYGAIEQRLKIIESDLKNVSKNPFHNSSKLLLEQASLYQQMLAYEDAMRMATTSSGRILQFSKKRKAGYQRFAADVATFKRQYSEFGNERMMKRLDDALAKIKEADEKLENISAQREKMSQDIRERRAQRSIDEIAANNTPPKKGALKKFLDFFNFGSKDNDTRSSIDEDLEQGTDFIADKYNAIYDLAQTMVRDENLRTLGEITSAVMDVFATTDAGKGDFTSERYSITPEDVRIALELGLSTQRAQRVKKKMSKMQKIRQFAASTQKLKDLIETVSDGNEVNNKNLEDFADSIKRYIGTILGEGFDVGHQIDSLPEAVNLLGDTIIDMDVAMFPGAVIDNEQLNVAKAKFKKALKLLGVLSSADKVDVSTALNKIKADIDAESSGIITDTDVNENDTADVAARKLEIERRRAAVREAHVDMEIALGELKAAKSRIDFEKRKAEASTTMEKLLTKTAGWREFLFELPRQIIFTVDASFIGIQAGLVVAGMLPRAVYDSTVQGNRQPMTNLVDFWKQNWALMSPMSSGNAFNKAAVRDAYKHLLRDVDATEMIRLRPDVFGSPLDNVAMDAREEFARANIGEKITNYLEDHPGASNKITRMTGRGLAKGFNYFADIYTMFMNNTRLYQYKTALMAMPDATDAQKKEVLINIMDFTGRGVATTAVGEGMTGQGMSSIVSAPRLYLSRIKVLQNFWVNAAKLGMDFKDKKNFRDLDSGSKEIMRQYMATATGLVGMYAIMSLFGWELEEDIKDGAFGKLKKEDKVIDISAGLQGFFKIPAFALYEGVKSGSQETADDIFGAATATQQASLQQKTTMTTALNTLKYKLHPTWGLLTSNVSRENAIGEGFGITAEQRLANNLKSILPISMQSGMDYFDLGRVRLDPDDNPDYWALAGLLGFNEYTYENSMKDIRVIEYLDELKYDAKKAITKRQAKKYIKGKDSERPITDIDESAYLESLYAAFKSHAQDETGKWILSQRNQGDTPTKDEIVDKANEIMERIGGDYYSKYIRNVDWKYKRGT